MTEEGKLGDDKTGSVQAAISSYSGRILETNPAVKNFQKIYPEKAYAKTRELHKAMRETEQFNESRKLAETATAEAQSELAIAKHTVKDLAVRIEESDVRTKARMDDLARLKIGDKTMEGALNPQDLMILRELEMMKREWSKLKLDIAAVLEEKRQAEKARDEYMLRARSYMSSLEAINKETEETNEEHVLVELARIEADKEYKQVEAVRREKAAEYSAAMEQTCKKKQRMIQEMKDVEELEQKLAITVSDANVLATELNLVKEMDNRRAMLDCSEEDGSSSLHSVMEELKAAKQELETVRKESFDFMASMDVVRGEHECIRDEVAQLKSNEKKTETVIQSLNSKLVRAKAKLEGATAAEEKVKSITSNLLVTLEQISSEGEAARKEHAGIIEETAAVKAEVKRMETDIDAAEDRLQVVLQELKAAKSSEAAVLENLKALTEKTMRSRASASTHSSRITISRFEYEYLTGHAAGAKEIADKKVAAAEAWIEVLKASEKEIETKYELLQKESRDLKLLEDNEVHETEEASMDAEEAVENEFENWWRSMGPEKLKAEVAAFSGKARNRSTKMAPARRGKGRVSASPMVRGTSRSTSFTVRRRRKVIPNLAAKLFGRKNGKTDS